MTEKTQAMKLKFKIENFHCGIPNTAVIFVFLLKIVKHLEKCLLES
jgi:hypothetical protein